MTSAQFKRKASSIERQIGKLFEMARELEVSAPDDELSVSASNLMQWLSQAANETSAMRAHLSPEEWGR